MSKTCPNCGRSSGIEFEVCDFCGVVVAKYLARKKREAEEQARRDAPVQCPQCKSSQLSATKKGFQYGKAAGGAFLLGPLGLLIGGSVGSSDLVLTCIKCGYHWTVKSPS